MLASQNGLNLDRNLGIESPAQTIGGAIDPLQRYTGHHRQQGPTVSDASKWDTTAKTVPWNHSHPIGIKKGVPTQGRPSIALTTLSQPLGKPGSEPLGFLHEADPVQTTSTDNITVNW
ncbi:Hypothetical predicted protein [Pelobates cultripes]|uniref:Uncharacterized protein n=1 Tax=Pelobates cultripes TaxID=61616 RepID=A0AAD1WBZ5_PELCU|nr:Hypothetical predicted protein [Pelobates cultripes]